MDPYGISQRADDLIELTRPRWWQFWRRPMTRVEALIKLEQALTGEGEPLQRFGVELAGSGLVRRRRRLRVKR